MTRWKPQTRCFFALMLFFASATTAFSQHKVTDTIYYDQNWRICEQPMAHYYRLGTLAINNDMWYFTGPVKDYTIGNRLLMEGFYRDSLRSGPFKFYTSAGKLWAAGNFDKGEVAGTWDYYYDDGSQMAKIAFEPGDNNFHFISYKDEAGNKLLENGTGDFTWPSDLFSTGVQYIVKGSFNSGKRSGTWSYRGSGTDYLYSFTEKYNKDGELKWSGYDIGHQGKRSPRIAMSFSPVRLQWMESIQMNPLFKRNGEAVCGLALLN